MVKCLLTKYKALGWILGIKRERRGGDGEKAGCGSQVPELFQQGRCPSTLRNNRREAHRCCRSRVFSLAVVQVSHFLYSTLSCPAFLKRGESLCRPGGHKLCLPILQPLAVQPQRGPSPSTWLYRPFRLLTGLWTRCWFSWFIKPSRASACQTGVFVFWMIRTLTCSV